MLTAKVTGNVWSTRRLAEIPNGAFLEVEAVNADVRIPRRHPDLGPGLALALRDLHHRAIRRVVGSPAARAPMRVVDFPHLSRRMTHQ